MRNFEKELTNEPNLKPGPGGNYAPSSAEAVAGWDSLRDVPFSGYQNNRSTIDPQKAQMKNTLLSKINYVILQMIYELKKVENTISSINQVISGAPSGYETRMMNDSKVAKADMDKVITQLYRCRDSANKISTVRKEL